MLQKKLKLFITFGSAVWLLLLFMRYVNHYLTAMSSLSTMEHTQHPLVNDPYFSDVINICLSSDTDRLLGLAATINSIQRNTKYRVKFHILVPQSAYEPLMKWITQTSLQYLNFDIRIFNVKKLAKKILVRDGRPELSKPMNYVRFYYADIFSYLKGRVIHVDDDCIVLGDIFELYHVALEDNQTVAFSNDCRTMAKRTTGIDTAYMKYVNFTNDHVKSLRMEPMECSFNTGVYVFDIDKWRKDNITSQLEYWMTLNTRENIYGNNVNGGGSQPPMMLVFYRHYMVLNPQWNLRHLGMLSARRYSQHVISSAKLLHWSGPFKPWHGQAAWSDIWDKYYIPDPEKKYRPVRKYVRVDDQLKHTASRSRL